MYLPLTYAHSSPVFDFRQPSGMTPVHVAVTYDSSNLLSTMLDALSPRDRAAAVGVRVEGAFYDRFNNQYIDGMQDASPLHVAAYHHATRSINTLIEYGAHVNAQTKVRTCVWMQLA